MRRKKERGWSGGVEMANNALFSYALFSYVRRRKCSEPPERERERETEREGRNGGGGRERKRGNPCSRPARRFLPLSACHPHLRFGGGLS
jgi:hypothetical protein